MQFLSLPSPITDIYFLGIFAFITAYITLVRPWNVVNLLPFALGITAFYVTIATKVNGEKLVPAVFLVCYCIYRTRYRINFDNIKEIKFTSMLLLLTAISVTVGAFYYPDSDIALPTAQSPFLRSIVRGSSYVMSFLYFVIPALFLPYLRNPLSPAKYFVYCGFVTATYAVYQNIAHIYGLPYRSIKYFEHKFGYGSLETLGGIFRANGLSNEPKQLGMFCLVALICAILLAFSRQTSRFGFLTLGGICLLGFLLPLSGSSLLAALLFGLIILIITIIRRKNYLPVSAFYVWIMLVVSISYLGITDKHIMLFEYADKLTMERIRLGSEYSQYVRIEKYVLSFFTSDPIFMITGFGMGNYTFWVYEKYRVGIDSKLGVMPINSSWLNLLADFGIFGIVFFMNIIYRANKTFFSDIVSSEANKALNSGIIMSYYCLILSACLMFFVQALNIFLFWVGMLVGFSRCLKQEEGK